MSYPFKVNDRNIYYLLASITIIVLLKIWFRGVEPDGPLFMLMPIATLIELVTGSAYTFVPEDGFYFPALHILINKSCSGLNFCCICFFLLCFVASGYNRHRRYGIFAALPICLVVAWLITLFVNTSRILLSLFINNRFASAGIPTPGWLHVTEGMFVYLFFLILVYLVTDFLFTKFTR